MPLLGADGSVTQVVSSFIDISERKESEQALRQRDAILESVASAAGRLLTAPDWEHGIEDVLRQLGAATAVSRVYIVPGYPESRAQRHEWVGRWRCPTVRHAGRRAVPDARSVWSAGSRSCARAASSRVRSTLSATTSATCCAAQGVCSTVVVPIFAGQLWWGFIAFDDCRDERDWPSGAVEVLRTAAGTLGAAIERRRADAERMQLVREQSARAEAEAAQRRQTFLAEASHILATSLDYEATLQSLANLVVPTLADYCSIDLREADDVDPPRCPGAVYLGRADASAGCRPTRRGDAPNGRAADSLPGSPWRRRRRGRRIHERPDGSVDDPRRQRMAC